MIASLFQGLARKYHRKPKKLELETGHIGHRGSQQDGDFRLRATVEGGTFTLKYKASVLRYGHTRQIEEQVALRPDINALLQRGDWPGFDE